ncbi:MAG: ASCH domain-containing protein [Gemmatimonadaceae bacterium]
MRALSIQQPWAWLIVNGYKDGVENRSWPTNERGERLIHAGKKVDAEGYEWVRETFPEIPLPPLEALERGGIVGRARLAACVTSLASRWFFGPYGFVFEDPTPLPFMPLRGQLGFFDVPTHGETNG